MTLLSRFFCFALLSLLATAGGYPACEHFSDASEGLPPAKFPIRGTLLSESDVMGASPALSPIRGWVFAFPKDAFEAFLDSLAPLYPRKLSPGRLSLNFEQFEVLPTLSDSTYTDSLGQFTAHIPSGSYYLCLANPQAPPNSIHTYTSLMGAKLIEVPPPQTEPLILTWGLGGLNQRKP